MTITDLEPTTRELPEPQPASTGPGSDKSAEPVVIASSDAEPEIAPVRVALVGLLSGAAAGVVLGGIFQGALGPIVGVFAAALAAFVVGFGLRSNRVLLQYLAIPAVFVAGYLAALVLPNPTGQRGTVPQLIHQAIANGGLAHPPVPFDPGWRFLLVGLVGLISSASVSLAASFRKPRLAIVLPLPLVIAGALNQPKGHELLGGVLALALMLAALSMSYSAELVGSADVSRRFEVRHLGSALVATVVALGLLVAMSHLSVLFPQPSHNRVANPQKPKVVPLSQIKDRPLFDAPGPGPWQLGVFSIYHAGGWLLPGYDPNSTKSLGAGGTLPDAPAGPTTDYKLTIRQLGGFTLPTPSEAVAAKSGDVRIGYDPTRSVLRLPDGAAPDGLHYTVTARRLPSGDELAADADSVSTPDMKPYLDAPAMPAAITQLLSTATSANRWDRLQLLRKQLYAKVLAKGGGLPVPVGPTSVVTMLNGAAASPFEIVAGEALLARWVGLPSRIGYGYYDATKSHGGEFRPADGANWLEVHFRDYGWVPILGTPLRAQADLNAVKKTQPQIRPSANQTLQIYVPVLSSPPVLTFEIVRYWAARVVPVVLLLWLLWRGIAMPARALRRRRRRQWALAHGPAGRVAVAYAEFRDVARDLALDDGRTTPLEFLGFVEDDVEHRELAWLTTRALWGDLTRDLREEDAVVAEQLSGSLQRRLRRGQSGIVRLGAVGSRTSLRAPWDPALPNVWPHLRGPSLRDAIRSLRRVRRKLSFQRLRRQFASHSTVALVLVAVVGVLLSGCAVQPDLKTRPVSLSFPTGMVPATADGLVASPEPSAATAFAAVGAHSAVARGQVWTLRQNGLVVGSVQVSQLKGGLSTASERIRLGIYGAINTGTYRWFKVRGKQWVGVQPQPQLLIYLWLPTNRRDAYVVLQLKSDVPDPQHVVEDLIAYQEGAS
jgi:hypothetical protein